MQQQKAIEFLIQAAQQGNQYALDKITEIYLNETKEKPIFYLELATLHISLIDEDEKCHRQKAYRYYLHAAQSGIEQAIYEIDKAMQRKDFPKELHLSIDQAIQQKKFPIKLYQSYANIFAKGISTDINLSKANEILWKELLYYVIQKDNNKVSETIDRATQQSNHPLFICFKNTTNDPNTLNHFDQYWDIASSLLENLKNLFNHYDDYFLFSNHHNHELANKIIKGLSNLGENPNQDQLINYFSETDLLNDLQKAQRSGRMITMVIYALKSIINPPKPELEIELQCGLPSGYAR